MGAMAVVAVSVGIARITRRADPTEVPHPSSDRSGAPDGTAASEDHRDATEVAAVESGLAPDADLSQDAPSQDHVPGADGVQAVPVAAVEQRDVADAPSAHNGQLDTSSPHAPVEETVVALVTPVRAKSGPAHKRPRRGRATANVAGAAVGAATTSPTQTRAPRHSRPAHKRSRDGRRAVPIATLCALVLLTAIAGFIGATTRASTTSNAATSRHAPHFADRTGDQGNRLVGLPKVAPVLPAAAAPPAAAPASLIAAPPIASREDFGFAPYWTLPQSGGFDISGLTTLAYFSIDVNADGSLDESGPGWNGYESQDLADLVTRAHAADKRVVLTVNDFDQGSLDALTSSPSAAVTLSKALIPALENKNLDGVNFDFEGAGSADQAGLTRLITEVSFDLRLADPHWQITMDTYASSAGDTSGFFNIPALAPAVDAFFVMAYEVNLAGSSTPLSPLTSGQFSDLSALTQYTAAVPASKVILGTGFFGIDWPTTDDSMQANAAGGANDIADAQIQGSGDPQYWDPVTDTGWTSYLVGTQWHESYWENPYGLYLESLLAAKFAVRGVGIWALGMESNDTTMIAALNGVAPPGGAGAIGPQTVPGATSVTTPSGAPTTTTGAPPPATTTTGPTQPGATTTTTTQPKTTTTTAPTTTTTTTVPLTTATAAGVAKVLTPVSATPVVGAALGTLSNFATNVAGLCLPGQRATARVFRICGPDQVHRRRHRTDGLRHPGLQLPALRAPARPDPPPAGSVGAQGDRSGPWAQH